MTGGFSARMDQGGFQNRINTLCCFYIAFLRPQTPTFFYFDLPPSDEKECTIVVPDVGYNKVIVPTGPSGHIDIITDILIRKIHSFTYWMVDLVDPPFPL